jgi:DNA-binding beta-propeller fold protein YncE
MMMAHLALTVVIASILTGEVSITASMKNTFQAAGLTAPQSIACSPQGSLWVADQLGTRIHLFSPSGVHVRSFGGEGQGRCEFTDRIRVADPGGLYLYAADTDGSRIVKLTRAGLCVKEIRPVGEEGLSIISRPTAITSQRGGLLYVADAGTGMIMTLDLFDHLTELTDKAVGGAPPLVEPSGLACGKELVYLTDGTRKEIAVLDRFGNALTRFRFPGTPGELDVRSDGLLAIVDCSTEDVVLFHNLQLVNRLSELLPDLSLSHPSDVCFGHEGTLFVADSGNDRVVQIAIQLSVTGVGDVRE